MSGLGQIKWQMRVDRGGMWTAPCDLCGSRSNTLGLELHHIINKGRTVGSREARDASEVKELFSLLCDKCHSIAHRPSIAEELLHRNIKRYGRWNVKRAYESAIGHQSGYGGIPFPRLKIRRINLVDGSKKAFQRSITVRISKSNR